MLSIYKVSVKCVCYPCKGKQSRLIRYVPVAILQNVRNPDVLWDGIIQGINHDFEKFHLELANN